MQISVIIPTHNRRDELEETLERLRAQEFAATDYEIIVVDDGSTPPVVLAPTTVPPRCTLLRLDGAGRSAARNAGAAAATGALLVFIDDDISVGPGFLQAHLLAHREWPDALCTGAIWLPEQVASRPFGRFRQALEMDGMPQSRGIVDCAGFCAAGNMAVARSIFLALRGFDTAMASGEDQDLALRHTASGGRLAYVPEARVVHRDRALDVREYCRRHEWGAQQLIPFVQRYPRHAQNVERQRINGFVNWGREPRTLSLKKLFKSALAFPPARAGLFAVAKVFEWTAPQSRSLDRVYRSLLGVHIQRGYRRGLKSFGAGAARPETTNGLATGPGDSVLA